MRKGQDDIPFSVSGPFITISLIPIQNAKSFVHCLNYRSLRQLTQLLSSKLLQVDTVCCCIRMRLLIPEALPRQAKGQTTKQCCTTLEYSTSPRCHLC